jgi:hypothetical protein
VFPEDFIEPNGGIELLEQGVHLRYSQNSGRNVTFFVVVAAVLTAGRRPQAANRR